MAKISKGDRIDLKRLTIELQDNAFDSLVHAVDHYVDQDHDRYLKYSVLHVVHATELILKSRLATFDPTLIFHGDGNTIGTESSTVSLYKLPEMLKEKCGVVLEPSGLAALESLRKARNRIEHLRDVEDRDALDRDLGQTLQFLETFLRHELGIELIEVLSPTTYDTLNNLIIGYEEAVRRARLVLEDLVAPDSDGVVDFKAVECPMCWLDMVPVPDHSQEYGMAVCRTPECRQSLYITDCARCGAAVASVSRVGWEDMEFCSTCIDFMINS